MLTERARASSTRARASPRRSRPHPHDLPAALREHGRAPARPRARSSRCSSASPTSWRRRRSLRGKVDGGARVPDPDGVIGDALISGADGRRRAQGDDHLRQSMRALPWYTALLIFVSNFAAELLVAACSSLIGGVVSWFRRWKKTPHGTPQVGRLRPQACRSSASSSRCSRSRASRARWPRCSRRRAAAQGDGHRAQRARQRAAREGRRRTPSDRSARARASPSRSSAAGSFPPIVTHMIAVGEKSGQLEQMLESVADAYDAQVETRVQSADQPARAADDRHHGRRGRLHRVLDPDAAHPDERLRPVRPTMTREDRRTETSSSRGSGGGGLRRGGCGSRAAAPVRLRPRRARAPRALGARERRARGERVDARDALLVVRRAVDAYRADHDGKCPRQLEELETAGLPHRRSRRTRGGVRCGWCARAGREGGGLRSS